MKLVPKIRTSLLYWIFVAVLGVCLFVLSNNAHAPQKAFDLTPAMYVVRGDDSAARPRTRAAQLAEELPRTSVVQAPAPSTPAAAPAAPKPEVDPHALEAQLRDELARQGFPNLGISVGRDGAVYLAGTLFGDSEPEQIDQIALKIPGVTAVHFTDIHMARPSGHAYFGTQTGRGHGGVEVLRVFRGSPAAAAGIQKGDVIVSFDNHPVKDPDDFRDLVREHPGGERVAVEIARGNQHQTCEVRLGQAAEMAAK